MPCRRVLPAQGLSWPEAGAVEKPFQRHEAFTKPEPDTATKAGLVRPAQDPCVVTAQRMSPKRSLSDIQRDVGHPDRQIGLLPSADRMDRSQRGAQILLVDLPWGWSLLEAGLCFGHALLHRFHRITAGKRPPRSCPVSFQDDVRVYQYDATVPNHDTSQVERTRDAVCGEQLRKALDAQAEHAGDPSDRDVTFVDGKADHFHKRF